jgi:hypothetical protein
MSRQTAVRRATTWEGSSRICELTAVDWGFPNRTKQDGLETIHPYPAKFIPELPGTVLDALPLEPGTAVLDPFVGSGTTLVEAQRRGYPSVGIDLNPIACLISRVKAQPTPPAFDEIVSRVSARALKVETPAIPAIPNLDHWFEANVSQTVAQLVQAISEAPIECHDALRVALSSILVRVSNQDSDTRYAAVRKNIKSTDVFALFHNACLKLSRALSARNYDLPPTRVIERDTLAVEPSEIAERIGAVITSPPYPNAYEYWLYHKYRMWWLGHDPLLVKKQEIGARAHFFGGNNHTAQDFTDQMRRTFALISAVLTPKGYASFVVGRSRIHGETINNAEVLERVSQEFGFRLAFNAERVIQANRKSFNLSHANIKTETVLIFSRDT